MSETNNSESTTENAGRVPFWHAPWEFAVHMFVGSLIFVLIAAFASVLGILSRIVESYGVSSFIILGLKIVEGGIFATDLLLFVVFLWRTSKRAVQRL